MRWLRDALVAGTPSRAVLARELCVRNDWRNSKGELCNAPVPSPVPALAPLIQRDRSAAADSFSPVEIEVLDELLSADDVLPPALRD